MYLVNYLEDGDWQYFGKCYKEDDLNDLVELLTYTHPNKAQQILKDEKELCVLNGSTEQLFYFRNKYILHQKPEYDYVKEYQKTIKK